RPPLRHSPVRPLPADCADRGSRPRQCRDDRQAPQRGSGERMGQKTWRAGIVSIMKHFRITETYHETNQAVTAQECLKKLAYFLRKDKKPHTPRRKSARMNLLPSAVAHQRFSSIRKNRDSEPSICRRPFSP